MVGQLHAPCDQMECLASSKRKAIKGKVASSPYDDVESGWSILEELPSHFMLHKMIPNSMMGISREARKQ